MTKIFKHINQHFKLYLAAILLSSIGMLGYIVTNISFEQDITKLLPADDSYIADQLNLIRRMGSLDQLLFDVTLDRSRFNEKELTKVAAQLAKELKKSKLFTSVTYRIDPNQGQKFMEGFFDKRFYLIRPDYLDPKKILSESYIKEKLERVKLKLYAMDSIAAKKMLRHDPLSLSDRAFQNIKNQDIGFAVKLKNNFLFSNDDRHILIITSPKEKSFSIDYTAVLLSKVKEIEAQLKKESPALVLTPYGGHLYAHSSASLIKGDIQLIFTLSLIGVVLIYYFSFRSIKTLLVSLIPIAYGIIVGLFALTFLLDSIHGITLVFGSTLIGICIDYSTHYFIQLGFQPQDTSANREYKAVEGIRNSLAMGYFTTLLVFVVFSFSELIFLKEIAIFSCVGISVAFFVSLLIVPQFKFQRNIVIGSFLKRIFQGISHISSFLQNHKLFSMVFLAVISIIAIFLSTGVTFDGDISRLNYVEPHLKKVEIDFKNRYGDISSSDMVMVSGKSVEDVLKVNDKVYSLLAGYRKDNSIQQFFNISPFLPSQMTQNLNIDRLLAVDWISFKSKFNSISQEFGFTEEAFEPFFQDLEAIKAGRSYIQIGDLKDTPFSQLMSKLFIHDEQQERYTALSYFKRQPNKDITELVKAINSIDRRVRYLNQGQLLTDIINKLKDEIIILMGTSFLLISFSLLLYYKDLKKSFIAIAPTIFGIAGSLAIFYLADNSINILSLFAMILIIGIGLDYGIFMVDSSADIESHTSIAILIAAVTTILSFGILIISQNTALSSIGAMIFLGVGLTLIFSVLMIPFLKPKPKSE